MQDPVCSESSLSARRKLRSLATYWTHSEDSDQTGRMPRLIWVFAVRTATLLVLSCRGSYHKRSATFWWWQYSKLLMKTQPLPSFAAVFFLFFLSFLLVFLSFYPIPLSFYLLSVFLFSSSQSVKQRLKLKNYTSSNTFLTLNTALPTKNTSVMIFNEILRYQHLIPKIN